MKTIQSIGPRSLLALALVLAVFCLGCKPKQETDTQETLSIIEQSRQSLEKAEELLKKDPGNKQALTDVINLSMQQGTHFEKKGDYARAKKYYQRVLEIDPDQLTARYHLGSVLAKQGNHQGAIVELEAVIRQNPSYSQSLYSTLADAYIATGQKEKARESLLKSIVLRPADIETYRKLADLYRDEGKTEEALQNEAIIAEIQKWGYPNRGYEEKTLEEWEQIAGEMGEKKQSEGGEGKKQGPRARQRALALYNIATYYDRAIDPDDYKTYEKAMKAWKKYLHFTKRMEGEDYYNKLIKKYAQTVKERRKVSLGEHEISPAVSTTKKMSNSINEFEAYREILDVVEAQAQKRENQADLAKVEELRNRLETLYDQNLKAKFFSIRKRAQNIVDKKLEPGSTMTVDDVNRQDQALRDEIQKLADEYGEQGDALFKEIEDICFKNGVQPPLVRSLKTH